MSTAVGSYLKKPATVSFKNPFCESASKIGTCLPFTSRNITFHPHFQCPHLFHEYSATHISILFIMRLAFIVNWRSIQRSVSRNLPTLRIFVRRLSYQLCFKISSHYVNTVVMPFAFIWLVVHSACWKQRNMRQINMFFYRAVTAELVKCYVLC